MPRDMRCVADSTNCTSGYLGISPRGATSRRDDNMAAEYWRRVEELLSFESLPRDDFKVEELSEAEQAADDIAL